MSATVQEGLLVTEAAKMAQAGFSFKETIRRIEELKHTSRIFFTCADLSYLKHGGRIGNVLQQAAIALKIKPIMFLHSGELQPAGIARSRKKSLQKVISDAQAFFKDKTSTTIASAPATAMIKRNSANSMPMWQQPWRKSALREKWNPIRSAVPSVYIQALPLWGSP